MRETEFWEKDNQREVSDMTNQQAIDNINRITKEA